MSAFEAAFAHAMEYEGRYSNHIADTGGETYRGIARNYHGDWLGWKIIDAHKSFQNFPATLENDTGLQQLVARFYKEKWTSWGLEHIKDPDIASEIFECAIIAGPKRAVKVTQGALKILGVTIDVDGAMGPRTIAALNQYEHKDALLKLMNGLQLMIFLLGAQAENEIVGIIRERMPKLKAFARGWMRRIQI